ncbi:ABC-type organic anion transporter ABCA8-like [Dendrobates tinctorius]|uniref:ABC-type organic anion transporter ABCA8-like n=1 Tax=Dendrobates tinctorius TaxID=92724 RepID=UPI003CCA02B8
MSGETRRNTSLWLHTFALLKKNLLLQWRKKWQTAQDWMNFVALVLMLFALTYIYRNSSKDKIKETEDLGRLDQFDKRDFVIGYVPSTPAVQEIMQKVNESMKNIGHTVQEFLDKEQMLQNTSRSADVGVIFDSKFQYTIRYKANTRDLRDVGTCRDDRMPCLSSLYWKNRFLFLQASIDAAIVELTTNHSVRANLISTVVVQMKSATRTRKILAMGSLILAMCMSYAILLYNMMVTISKERKELREIMRMMGLRDLAYWLSWGLLYVVYFVIIAPVMTLIVKIFVFVESSYAVILLLFLFYGMSMISFTFMLCALFRTPSHTVTADFFPMLIMGILSLLPLVKVLPKALEIFLCIFPPFAFSLGITESIHMENDFQGVFFSDITGDACHILTSYIGLLLDSVLYILLTLYFDKIIADKHGLKFGPLFLLCPSYWSKGKMTTIPLDTMDRDRSGAEDHIEKVPVELLGKEAIRLNKVKKIFGSKNQMTEALRDLNLDVYEGHITALLGHSGAGKTTLLNILGGMSKVSTGSVSVYNHQLSSPHDLEEMQKKIGFCPQFDVKFDFLTVRENLEIFSRIKGVAAREVTSEVRKVISDLDLNNIEDTKASKLSGGQRRRLTLAIALLGNPEVLLLDEPTSGLDPFSRHQVWSTLQERKANRVILFSTQFMDEADILADRKVVLSRGMVKCVGSSWFLKRKWGIGYHLRMQVSPSCNLDAITSLVQEHVSSAKISAQNVEALTFTLPFDKMDSFPALFSHLDEHMGADIVSYGVSITTLDDVFLKLEGEEEIEKGDYGVFAREQSEDESRELSSEVEDSDLLLLDSGTITVHGLALWRQQVLTVAWIRFLKLKRAMISIRSIVLLLAVFIASILYFTTITSKRWYNWKITPHLYFRGMRHREHKYYTSLLVHNNTGASIEDVVNGIKAQDISVKVRDGPYDRNTTGYNGALELSLQNQSYSFTIIGNPQIQNSLPVLMNIISNAFLKSFGSTEDIEIWNTPVYPDSDRFTYSLFFVSLLYMAFGSGFVPYFAMSSVQDYEIKARSQLRLAGLFPSAYWCGQALVDVALYWLLLFVMVAILFAMNSSIVLSVKHIVLLIVDVLGFGAAMVLFVYVITFLLVRKKKGMCSSDHWSATFILISILPLLVEVFLRSSVMLYIFLLTLLPPSNFLAFLVHLCKTNHIIDYESRTGIFTNLTIPYLQIIMLWIVLGYLEKKYGAGCLKMDPIFKFDERKYMVKKNPEELRGADVDVLAEKQKVQRLKTTTNKEEKPAILVDSLRQEYEVKSRNVFKKNSVKQVGARNVSFFVKKGEVLGLLGPNGAGKTTCILMLAGELEPTAGEVVLCSAADISSAPLGYCPQSTPLWPKLTVSEHLESYAAVSGMKKDDVEKAIKRVSEALELKEHLNKPVEKLPVGVSRKVCFAISMLGNPTIALLDEPSTGLDPKGQQRLWRALRAAFRNKDRGAILTTHYMEEAEAVCDRVAIMVSGKLRCIGSIQQLKSKFGKGYLLEMKVKDSQQVDEIHQEISRIFPQADRQDRFSSLLCYKIPMDNVQSLSQAFSQLEEAKRIHDIEEYSFSQPTLEQVFLELAKQQNEQCSQDIVLTQRNMTTENV